MQTIADKVDYFKAQNDHSSIVNLLLEVDSHSPDYHSTRLDLIYSLYALGDFSRASTLCSEYSIILASVETYWCLYGSALRKAGLLNQAVEVYEQAIQRFPGSSALLNNLSNVLIDTGSFDRAEKILVDLLSRQPDNAHDVQVNLDRLHTLKQTPPVHTSTATTLPASIQDPLVAAFNSEECQISWSKYSSEINQSNAYLESLNLPKRSQDDEINEMIVAAELLCLQDPHSALRECRILTQLIGLQPRICEIAAKAFMSLGDPKSAEICLLRAQLLLEEPSISIWLNLSNIALMRDDYHFFRSYFDSVSFLSEAQQDTHKQTIDSIKTNSKLKSKSSSFAL